MELLIVLALFAALGIAAVLGGADSRPKIDTSRDWGLHSWNRDNESS
jgi:hypothetical protein